MNLVYPAETDAFRADLRAWLTGEVSRLRADGAEGPDFARRWQQVIYDTGWAVPTWPEEYGGRGLDVLRASIALEEFAAAGAPLPLPGGGELLLGPTIMHWGTDEQRQRFLPPIARGRETWCQGFSEPESGSDLASLRTSAVLDGDTYVINGHKIWTSEADDADFMFTLVRTDPQAPVHRGISYLLVPLHQPGIEVRPISQPDGRAGFTEVLLRDARCPVANRIGEAGQGWQVAMGTLGIERGVSSSASHLPYLAEWRETVSAARATGSIDTPGVRERLVRSWASIELMRQQSARILTAAVHGPVDPHVGTVSASFKFFYTELHQALADLAMDVRGPAAGVLTGEQGAPQPWGVGMGSRTPMHFYPLDDTQSVYLFSRSQTIYGGSSQVQRTIVAERALGLPRGAR
jgi:alkylation response protein AidB-like acyl-CoA dehydrogenase